MGINTSSELVDLIHRDQIHDMDSLQLRIAYYRTGSKAIHREFMRRFPRVRITLSYYEKVENNLIHPITKLTAVDLSRPQ